MQITKAVPIQHPARRFYRFGEFRLDVYERTLSSGEQRIHLGPMVFETLVALVEKAGSIVSKDELFSRVWPGVFVQESSLSQNVYLLRRALGGDHYIETVPKIGYRFTVTVDAESAVPAAPIAVPSRALPAPARKTRYWLWIVAIVPILAVAALLWSTARPARIRSIAVLPFVSLGDPPNQAAIADGLTEQLIYELTRTGAVRVVARTSSSQFKNQARDVREIGKALSVDAILEGSVRRDRETLRVTAQLNRSADGYLLWSRTFDRHLPETLGLQEEIAQSLTESVLGVPATGAARTLFLPKNADAREAYLEGRYQWSIETGLGMWSAIESFKKSVAIEPDFAPAHAMLADSYLMLAAYDIANPSEMLPLARRAAAKALDLNPALPRALSAAALAEILDGADRAQAERHFLEAIRLSPTTPRHRFLYAYYLLGPAGRVDEAEKTLAIAEETDPFAATVSAGKIGAPFFARNYQRAVASGEKILKKFPDCFLCSFVDSWALGAAGRYEDSLRMMEHADKLAGGEYTPSKRWKAFCFAKLGRREEARKIALKMEEESHHRFQSAEHIAHTYAALGDRRQALAWLNKAYDQRSFGMSFLDAFPAYDFLRGDPDYEKIRQAMRLPAH